MALTPELAEVVAYYTREPETVRLSKDAGGALEFARTQELLRRHLPRPPATVLDIGGGTGLYARWLAAAGYRVILLDLVSAHTRLVRAAADQPPEAPLDGIIQGDARSLPLAEARADVALLLGPLYHLTEREDRVRALREARRVLRPGGRVFAVGVSRFAGLLTGLYFESMDDPEFLTLMWGGLRDGQHRNPTEKQYWTTAYFHHPDDLRDEVAEAGFVIVDRVAVEGPQFVVRDLAAWWDDARRRELLLEAIRAVEREPTLMGLSSHVLVVGERVGPHSS
ncbi:MAG TPA: class I SAM-dependent methyltransferase [Dehalococcoidia bacterium]|nr:class I SAM-dependent methyltransferase [Dehalococcoidia bacterium]